jgi:hypothetical protein
MPQQNRQTHFVRNHSEIGALVAQVFGNVIIDTVRQLVEIATSNESPLEHELMQKLSQAERDIFRRLDREQFLQFLCKQAGLSYRLEFHPGVPPELSNTKRIQLHLQTKHVTHDVQRTPPNVIPLFDAKYFTARNDEDLRGIDRSDIDMRCCGKVSF